VAGLGCALGAGLARAGGFYVPEVGVRAVGMGGAAVADARSPSVMFHNPAGLLGGGTELELGGDLVLPDVTHFRRPVTDPVSGQTVSFDQASNSNRVGGVPFLAARFDLGRPDLALGLGAFVPFGATLQYPGDGAQRFVVTSVALRTLYLGPALAWRPLSRLTVGVSVSYVYADFALQQSNALQFVTGDPEANPNPAAGVEGRTRVDTRDRFSLAASAGLQFGRPDEPFTLGLAVMAPTRLQLTGSAEIVNASIMPIDDGVGTLPAGRRSDDVRLTLPLPLVVRAGVQVRPSAGLALALDVNWQRWSTTRRLVIDFAHQYPLLLTPGANLVDVVMDNRWRDTLSVRLGAEAHPLGGGLERLALRAGLLLDQSPIDDRQFDLLTPDSDKLGLSLGAGYRIALGARSVQIELAFLQLFFRERDIGPSPLVDPDSGRNYPGSDRTILNKPAPSFYYGVTRSRISLLSAGARLGF
jgi:long-chain fatty acid transport protein